MSGRIEAAGVPIFFPEEHADTAAAMAEAVERTASIVEQRWKLAVPANCEAHVMTGCMEFIDRTTPSHLRFWVKLTQPLWRGRAERAFALAGGWSIPWRRRPVIGVKPPALLAQAEIRLGDRLFVAVPDLLEKVRHLTCHEFTHACTAHLRLPPWLNEGLAMLAVDHMTGTVTVREGTRDLAGMDGIPSSKAYREVRRRDHDALIRLYAAGYWNTRRLETERPEVLVALLARRHSVSELAEIVSQALR
jgi:hypothetical protein